MEKEMMEKEKKEIEAQENVRKQSFRRPGSLASEEIKEIKRRLAEIEKKAGKIEIPRQGIDLKINLKKGFDKITEILNKMLREDIKEYQEIETKKIGDFKVEKGLRMSFLDEASGDDKVKADKKKNKLLREK